MDFIRAAKLHGILPVAALRVRARFLKENCQAWADYVNRNPESLSTLVALEWLEDDARALVEIQDAIANLEKIKDATNGITPEMISRARDYPVDSLVDFKRGKTAAWCHEDRNPSMYHGTRTNTAVCPVCDKKFDSIGILMERDGLSFIDAVNNLNGR